MSSSRAIQPMLDSHFHYPPSTNALNYNYNGNNHNYSNFLPQHGQSIYDPYRSQAQAHNSLQAPPPHYGYSYTGPQPQHNYAGATSHQQQPPLPHMLQIPPMVQPSNNNEDVQMNGRISTGPYGYQYHYDRRFSHPQIGYYDLITGEYRYHRSDSNFNTSPMLGGSNYAGETEPPMCENTCKCCQIKLPFNYLTISLITCLMLLLMFSLFKTILSSKPPRPGNIVNAHLFHEMIWITGTLTMIFIVLIIIKYVFTNPHSPLYCATCARCKLFGILLATDQSSFENTVTTLIGARGGVPNGTSLTSFASKQQHFSQPRLSIFGSNNARTNTRGEDFV